MKIDKDQTSVFKNHLKGEFLSYKVSVKYKENCERYKMFYRCKKLFTKMNHLFIIIKLSHVS